MNKLQIFLITKIMIISLAFGQMQFSGHIENYADWDEDVIITGSVWVDEQATLIIQSGVTVFFTFQDANVDGIGDHDFIINGQLVANGVIFTSNEENPSKGDWGGFDFTSVNGNANFIDSEIHYAHQGLHVNGNYVTLNNTTITNCSDYGIRIENSVQTSSFTEVNILDNSGYGMNVENAPVSIIGGLVFGNGSYGFQSNSGSDVSVNDLIVSSNASTGIWINGTQGATFDGIRTVSNGNEGIKIESANPSFTNSLISNNSGIGIDISGSTSSASFDYCDVLNNQQGGFYIYSEGSNTNITHSNIEGNSGKGQVQIIDNSSLTINYSNVIPDYVNEIISTISADILFVNQDGCTSGRETTSSTLWLSDLPTFTSYDQISFHVNSSSHSCNGNDDWDFQIKNQHGHDQWNRSGSSNFSYDEWVDVGMHDGYYIRQWHHYFHSVYWELDFIKIKGSFSNPLSFISCNTGLMIDAQFNWWGQVNGIDDLILQGVSGTVDYGQSQITEISGIGATYDNLPPSITITSPTTMEPDPESITITWSDMDVDDDAGISLYSLMINEEGSTDAPQLITSGISEDDETDSYTWNLTGVPYGIYVIQAVIDDGMNQDYSSSLTQVMVGPLTVSLPQNASAPAGGDILIPVELINPTHGDSIISFSFQLGYNPAILDADSTMGIVTTNSLTSGWFVTANFNTPGQLNVNGYGLETIANRGTLLEIPFNVKSWASNFDEVNLNMNNFIFNTGEPEPEIINGLFTVINEFNITGSVQYYASEHGIPHVSLELSDDEGEIVSELSSGNDGTFAFESIPSANYNINSSYEELIPMDENLPIISPYDAALVAMYQVNSVEFTTNQVIAGDVDGDGSIFAYDAALILYYSVGLSDSFPAGRWAFPDDHSYELLQDFENQSISGIAIGDPSGNWMPSDERGRSSMELAIDAREGEEISILVSSSNEFQSALLDFHFDPEKLEFKEISISSELSGFYGTENLEEGRFRYGAFSGNSTQVSDEAYTLIFEARADLQLEIMHGNAFFDEIQGDVFLSESEQLQGDLNGDFTLNILDVVLLVDCILGIVEFDYVELADVNGDEQVNVLDVVILVHMVLGDEGLSREVGSKAVIQKGFNSLHLESDGNITIQLTLEHGADFILSFTDNSYFSKAHTMDDKTNIVIINPDDGILFTTNDVFSIEGVIGASLHGYVNVDIMDLPTKYSLSQPYPNPFNPSTTFNWTLATPTTYSIIAYNIMGKEVAVLEQGYKNPGEYDVTWNAKEIPSGIYFIKLKVGNKLVDVKKAMLLK